MECAAAEAFELLRADKVDLKKVADSLASSDEGARTIRSITSFMISTVNRCLDYTKVSKGLELVPRNETFDLAESLQLPIDCINGLHGAGVIKIDPISADICRFVISDKQVSSVPQAY